MIVNSRITQIELLKILNDTPDHRASTGLFYRIESISYPFDACQKPNNTRYGSARVCVCALSANKWVEKTKSTKYARYSMPVSAAFVDAKTIDSANSHHIITIQKQREIEKEKTPT